MLLNSNLSLEAQYATLVHELGHLYCGHLGTPDQKWWPDRRGLSLAIREFEAESICYLVCTRFGIDNASEQYLANYVRDHEATPPISVDCVMKPSSYVAKYEGGDRRLDVLEFLDVAAAIGFDPCAAIRSLLRKSR
jgi:hypothetical protein